MGEALLLEVRAFMRAPGAELCFWHMSFVLAVGRKSTFRITSITSIKLLHKLRLLCFSKQIQNTFRGQDFMQNR